MVQQSNKLLFQQTFIYQDRVKSTETCKWFVKSSRTKVNETDENSLQETCGKQNPPPPPMIAELSPFPQDWSIENVFEWPEHWNKSSQIVQSRNKEKNIYMCVRQPRWKISCTPVWRFPETSPSNGSQGVSSEPGGSIIFICKSFGQAPHIYPGTHRKPTGGLSQGVTSCARWLVRPFNFGRNLKTQRHGAESHEGCHPTTPQWCRNLSRENSDLSKQWLILYNVRKRTYTFAWTCSKMAHRHWTIQSIYSAVGLATNRSEQHTDTHVYQFCLGHEKMFVSLVINLGFFGGFKEPFRQKAEFRVWWHLFVPHYAAARSPSKQVCNPTNSDTQQLQPWFYPFSLVPLSKIRNTWSAPPAEKALQQNFVTWSGSTWIR